MMTHHFSLMHVLLNGQFRDDPASLTHGRIRRDFPIYFNKPPIAFLIESRRYNVTLTDIFDLVYLRFG